MMDYILCYKEAFMLGTATGIGICYLYLTKSKARAQ